MPKGTGKEFDEILTKIIRRYGAQTDQIRTTQIIESKLGRHTATYADAEHYAQDVGKALTDAFREYLPEALTDGRLYRAAAEVLVEQPMKKAGQDVAEVAARIQKQLNEDAGIGMNAIIPEMNQDHIDGIITGICNAESFEDGEEVFYDRVENAMEGYVDDIVRENTDFQYQAGLSPIIERIPVGECCEWCAKLAGKYPYEEVRDRGNDVFRRHKNCHCQVLYNPRDGSKRKQDAHSREWGTEEEFRERRLHYEQKEDFEHDYKKIKARKIKNYGENNLFIDQNVNLSPREIRRINDQITRAKELHGVVGSCNSAFVIVNDKSCLAAYNPRTNTFFISSSMADEKRIVLLQDGYACPRDTRSTMVHEIFHWKDAEEYRTSIGVITDASSKSDYSVYQREKAVLALTQAGVISEQDCREISEYAAKRFLDNDFEEVYTEYRTEQLIEGGVQN